MSIFSESVLGRSWPVAVESRWHLACVDGPDVGAVIPLAGVSGSLVVGRAVQPVVDVQMSREHVRVRWDATGVWVCDASSTNGVWVRRRGLRFFPRNVRVGVGAWTVLRVGDETCCGVSRWQLRVRPADFVCPPGWDWQSFARGGVGGSRRWLLGLRSSMGGGRGVFGREGSWAGFACSGGFGGVSGAAGRSQKLGMTWFMRGFSLILPAVFIPLTLGRFLGVSPWWFASILGAIVLLLSVLAWVRRRRERPWDGAMVVLAMLTFRAGGLSSTKSQEGRSQVSWMTAPASLARQSSGSVLPADASVFSGGMHIGFGEHSSLAERSELGKLPAFCGVEALGFHGSHALLHAFWTLTALCFPWSGCHVVSPTGVFIIGAGGPVVHLCEIPLSQLQTESHSQPWELDSQDSATSCPCSVFSPCDHALHCAISDDIALLPSWCSHIIDANTPIGLSFSWLRQLIQVHTPEASAPQPIPDLVFFNDLEHPINTSIQPTTTLDSPSQRGRSFNVSIGQKSDLHTQHVDLIHDGPHALIVGTTGSGKSEALITLLCAIATHYSPDVVRIIAIDYKGGASLQPLQGLPHVQHVLTDLNPQQTRRSFDGIRFLLRQREALLAEHGYSSLSDWEKAHPRQAPPRIIIAFDEFSTFADIHPDLFNDALRLAAQGRALGLHVIFATQRPDKSLNAHVLSNVDLRIVLRCRDPLASQTLIGSHAALELPAIPGRAICNGSEVFQTAWIPDIAQTVSHIRTSWDHIHLSHLWAPPLPEHYEAEELARTPCALETTIPAADSSSLHRHHRHVGLVDGVHIGSHYPLAWTGGNCRFEGLMHQRDDLWQHMSVFAKECALEKGSDTRIFVCTTRFLTFNTHLPYQHINVDSGVHVAALAAFVSEKQPRSIVLIEDLEQFQRALSQTLGSAAGISLWSSVLNASLSGETVLIGASYMPKTLWDKESHYFTYRIMKVASEQHVQSCALPADTPPTPHFGHFMLISAPPDALCQTNPQASSIPVPIRLASPDTTPTIPGHTIITSSKPLPAKHKSDRHTCPLWHDITGNAVTLPSDVVYVRHSNSYNRGACLQDQSTSDTVKVIEAHMWTQVREVIHRPIVLEVLSDDLRRVLLPHAYRNDWLLRLKNLPDGCAVFVHQGEASLLFECQFQQV